VHLLAFLVYTLLAFLFSHQLISHWHTAIPGGMEDTRLFVWNAWWFRHAIDTLHVNPFFTPLLFHPFGASLISHDFPLWNNLVTYAAQSGGWGLAAASNLWFMLSWILAGYCSYLLAWEVTRLRAPALVAGVYVMTHTYTLARAMQNWGQFNLWVIALFLWLLVRAHRTERLRDYALGGAALAWTAAGHYYFLIYSGVIWLVSAVARISPRLPSFETKEPSRRLQKFFKGIALAGAGVAGWIIFFKPGQVAIGSSLIGLKTPSNALLVMWMAVFAFVLTHFRLSFRPQEIEAAERRQRLLREGVLVVSSLLCLSPLLLGAIQLASEGGYPRQSILWKTHLPGANLLSLFMPNQLHAVWGQSISQWFFDHGMQPQEQAASIGWVCLIVMVMGFTKGPRAQVSGPSTGAWELRPGPWLALALSSTLLSMGTYLHVLNVNTWMPLPFYVWRLLPVFGNVRVPERWMAVGAIAWGVVLAIALMALARKKSWPLVKVSLAAGALVILENWPGIPVGSLPQEHAIHKQLKSLPAGAVLPVPLYIGDSSVGAGDAPAGLVWESLGVQVYHEKPVLGGYLGRIPRGLIRKYKADPFLDQLIALEEGKSTNARPMALSQACQSMNAFSVEYVLLYPESLPVRTLSFVKGSLRLIPLQLSKDLELYRLDCR
jgi:hypothetical protein